MKCMNSVCTCFVIIVYVILIFLFFSLKREYYLPWEDERYKNCTSPKACLMFCEEPNGEKFTDEFIKEHFPIHHFSIQKFNVTWHKLECRFVENRIIIDDHPSFDISRSGSVRYGDRNLYLPEYCLRPFKGESWLKLKLEFCEKNFSFLSFIKYFLLSMAAIFLIIPSGIYMVFDQIRKTLNGKLCIALALVHVFMIFIIIGSIFVDYNVRNNLLNVAFISMIFIFHCMGFDVYSNLKYFNESHKQSKCFKKSFYFLFVYAVITMILAFGLKSVYNSYFDLHFKIQFTASQIWFLFFALTIFIDIFLLIFSFYHLIILKKLNSNNDDTRYDVEKERFWLYIKLFAILIIVWFNQMNLNTMFEPYESEIIADAIKCFSAGLSAFLLIWTPHVYSLVLGKYRSIKNSNA